MDYKLLNDGTTKISGLSLGTWAFSGAPVWGGCDRDAAIETVHEALERGINLFDTAEKYGDGAAELVLGQALKGRRQDAVLATKVYSNHLHHDDVIAACEASLRRLQTDYIDILQIHWPNEDIPVEETFGAFDELKKAGKIRMVSVCNHGIQCLEHVAPYGVVLNQMPYSLVWRLAEHQLSPVMEERKILLWAYSPLAQGLLTGKFRTLEDVPMNRRANRMYDSKWGAGRHTDGGFEREIFAFLDKLRTLCDETGYDMPTLALNFLKARPGMGSVLVGARNVHQLRQNLDAYETQVPADVLAWLEELSAGLRDQMGDNADLWENAPNRYGKPGRMY